MTKEERIELVFETLSKIVGFEVKPGKELYMIGNGEKVICKIDEDLNLLYKKPDGSFLHSGYSILPIFRGGYQLEEIKKPLTTEKERDFLRHFKFDTLKILSRLYMYDKDGFIVNSIMLENINCGFNGLENGKRYSAKELGL